jgi:hypothetical protein
MWLDLDDELTELFGDVRWHFGFDSGRAGGAVGVAVRNIPDYTKVTDDISTSEIATWPGRRKEAETKRKARKASKEMARRRAKGIPDKRNCQLSYEQVKALAEHPGTLTATAKDLGIAIASVHRWRQRLQAANGDVELARATPFKR